MQWYTEICYISKIFINERKWTQKHVKEVSNIFENNNNNFTIRSINHSNNKLAEMAN